MNSEKSIEFMGATIHKSSDVHYEKEYPNVKYRWYIEAYCQVNFGRWLGFATTDRIWFTTLETAKAVG